MSSPNWAEILPDLLNLVAYTLTEGILLGHSQSATRPLVCISEYSLYHLYAFRGDSDADYIEAILRVHLRKLNRLARVCRDWAYGLDWGVVYANIRLRLRALRKGKLARYIPHLAATACSSAFMHAAVCSALAHPQRKRGFVQIARDESWYGSPDSWDKVKQWVYKGTSTRMGVRVVWSTAPSLSRDLCAPLLFLDDVRALIEKYDIPKMHWTERRDMVQKHGLTHHHLLNQIWLPDCDGGITVGYWTDPDEVRRAFAAWRASESALTAIRDELKTFRTPARKRGRRPDTNPRPKKKARRE